MAYTPSLYRVKKYSKYLAYYVEFIKRNDFKSVFDSIKYVIFKKLPQKSRQIETFMGKFLLRSNTTDFQFVNYTYESKVKDYILSIVNDMDSFIDIGACIGEYCIWLASKGIKSHAVEPVNYLAIKENVKLNHKAGKLLTIFPYALGAENKKVSFNVLENVTSSSHIDKSNQEGDIEMKKFDDLFLPNKSDKISLIKLDVEGMELEVLKGAKKFITESNKVQIIFESSFTGIAQGAREVLKEYGEFIYIDLDEVNTLAVKL